ncbi:MAG: hypothetical protein HQL28_05185, partial [Candidatus Omnitrophica bacterium]|nr:hypothetical protein [Candidatus Omnitrophota bacterium]
KQQQEDKPEPAKEALLGDPLVRLLMGLRTAEGLRADVSSDRAGYIKIGDNEIPVDGLARFFRGIGGAGIELPREMIAPDKTKWEISFERARNYYMRKNSFLGGIRIGLLFLRRGFAVFFGETLPNEIILKKMKLRKFLSPPPEEKFDKDLVILAYMPDSDKLYKKIKDPAASDQKGKIILTEADLKEFFAPLAGIERKADGTFPDYKLPKTLQILLKYVTIKKGLTADDLLFRMAQALSAHARTNPGIIKNIPENERRGFIKTNNPKVRKASAEKAVKLFHLARAYSGDGKLTKNIAYGLARAYAALKDEENTVKYMKYEELSKEGPGKNLGAKVGAGAGVLFGVVTTYAAFVIGASIVSAPLVTLLVAFSFLAVLALLAKMLIIVGVGTVIGAALGALIFKAHPTTKLSEIPDDLLVIMVEASLKKDDVRGAEKYFRNIRADNFKNTAKEKIYVYKSAKDPAGMMKSLWFGYRLPEDTRLKPLEWKMPVWKYAVFIGVLGAVLATFGVASPFILSGAITLMATGLGILLVVELAIKPVYKGSPVEKLNNNKTLNGFVSAAIFSAAMKLFAQVWGMLGEITSAIYHSVSSGTVATHAASAGVMKAAWLTKLMSYGAFMSTGIAYFGIAIAVFVVGYVVYRVIKNVIAVNRERRLFYGGNKKGANEMFAARYLLKAFDAFMKEEEKNKPEMSGMEGIPGLPNMPGKKKEEKPADKDKFKNAEESLKKIKGLGLAAENGAPFNDEIMRLAFLYHVIPAIKTAKNDSERKALLKWANTVFADMRKRTFAYKGKDRGRYVASLKMIKAHLIMAENGDLEKARRFLDSALDNIEKQDESSANLVLLADHYRTALLLLHARSGIQEKKVTEEPARGAEEPFGMPSMASGGFKKPTVEKAVVKLTKKEREELPSLRDEIKTILFEKLTVPAEGEPDRLALRDRVAAFRDDAKLLETITAAFAKETEDAKNDVKKIEEGTPGSSIDGTALPAAEPAEETLVGHIKGQAEDFIKENTVTVELKEKSPPEITLLEYQLLMAWDELRAKPYSYFYFGWKKWYKALFLIMTVIPWTILPLSRLIHRYVTLTRHYNKYLKAVRNNLDKLDAKTRVIFIGYYMKSAKFSARKDIDPFIGECLKAMESTLHKPMPADADKNRFDKEKWETLKISAERINELLGMIEAVIDGKWWVRTVNHFKLKKMPGVLKGYTIRLDAMPKDPVSGDMDESVRSTKDRVNALLGKINAYFDKNTVLIDEAIEKESAQNIKGKDETKKREKSERIKGLIGYCQTFIRSSRQEIRAKLITEKLLPLYSDYYSVLGSMKRSVNVSAVGDVSDRNIQAEFKELIEFICLWGPGSSELSGVLSHRVFRDMFEKLLYQLFEGNAGTGNTAVPLDTPAKKVAAINVFLGDLGLGSITTPANALRTSQKAMWAYIVGFSMAKITMTETDQKEIESGLNIKAFWISFTESILKDDNIPSTLKDFLVKNMSIFDFYFRNDGSTDIFVNILKDTSGSIITRKAVKDLLALKLRFLSGTDLETCRIFARDKVKEVVANLFGMDPLSNDYRDLVRETELLFELLDAADKEIKLRWEYHWRKAKKDRPADEQPPVTLYLTDGHDMDLIMSGCLESISLIHDKRLLAARVGRYAELINEFHNAVSGDSYAEKCVYDLLADGKTYPAELWEKLLENGRFNLRLKLAIMNKLITAYKASGLKGAELNEKYQKLSDELVKLIGTVKIPGEKITQDEMRKEMGMMQASADDLKNIVKSLDTFLDGIDSDNPLKQYLAIKLHAAVISFRDTLTKANELAAKSGVAAVSVDIDNLVLAPLRDKILAVKKAILNGAKEAQLKFKERETAISGVIAESLAGEGDIAGAVAEHGKSADAFKKLFDEYSEESEDLPLAQRAARYAWEALENAADLSGLLEDDALRVKAGIARDKWIFENWDKFHEDTRNAIIARHEQDMEGYSCKPEGFAARSRDMAVRNILLSDMDPAKRVEFAEGAGGKVLGHQKKVNEYETSVKSSEGEIKIIQEGKDGINESEAKKAAIEENLKRLEVELKQKEDEIKSDLANLNAQFRDKDKVPGVDEDGRGRVQGTAELAEMDTGSVPKEVDVEKLKQNIIAKRTEFESAKRALGAANEKKKAAEAKRTKTDSQRTKFAKKRDETLSPDYVHENIVTAINQLFGVLRDRRQSADGVKDKAMSLLLDLYNLGDMSIRDKIMDGITESETYITGVVDIAAKTKLLVRLNDFKIKLVVADTGDDFAPALIKLLVIPNGASSFAIGTKGGVVHVPIDVYLKAALAEARKSFKGIDEEYARFLTEICLVNAGTPLGTLLFAALIDLFYEKGAVKDIKTGAEFKIEDIKGLPAYKVMEKVSADKRRPEFALTITAFMEALKKKHDSGGAWHKLKSAAKELEAAGFLGTRDAAVGRLIEALDPSGFVEEAKRLMTETSDPQSDGYYNAILKCRDALAIEAENEEAHFLLGRLYYAQGRYTKAMDEFKKLSDKKGIFQRSACGYLAEIYSIKYNTEDRMKMFKNIADMLFEEKKYDEALTYIKGAIVLDGANAEYLFLKAKILHAKGGRDLTGCIKILSELLDKKNREKFRGIGLIEKDAYVLRTEAYKVRNEKGDLKKARKDAEIALKLGQGTRTVFEILADKIFPVRFLRFKRAKTIRDDARALYKKAIDAKPDE